MTERTPRTSVLLLGLLLVGIGGTGALAAQTGLSATQAGSILLLVCAAILLSFLVDQARSRTGTAEAPSEAEGGHT